MRRYPNLYGDLSAGSGFGAISRDPEFGYAFLEEFQDRLYFALDLCDPANITQPIRIGLAAFLDDAVTRGKSATKPIIKSPGAMQKGICRHSTAANAGREWL